MLLRVSGFADWDSVLDAQETVQEILRLYQETVGQVHARPVAVKDNVPSSAAPACVARTNRHVEAVGAADW